MAIHLTDDGTLDTVLRCSECGEEMRYNSYGRELATGKWIVIGHWSEE